MIFAAFHPLALPHFTPPKNQPCGFPRHGEPPIIPKETSTKFHPPKTETFKIIKNHQK